MAYKIAVASSDGVFINKKFRDADEFLIVNVQEDGTYDISEKRRFLSPEVGKKQQAVNEISYETDKELPPKEKHSCGSTTGCGGKEGCTGVAGCGGENSPKLEMISDCRSLICTQIGFKIHKQLEKKAISAFEVDCRIEEAVEKIIQYYDKVDNHKSLRGFTRKNN